MPPIPVHTCGKGCPCKAYNRLDLEQLRIVSPKVSKAIIDQAWHSEATPKQVRRGGSEEVLAKNKGRTRPSFCYTTSTNQQHAPDCLTSFRPARPCQKTTLNNTLVPTKAEADR